MITSALTIRSASSTPSSMGSISSRQASRGSNRRRQAGPATRRAICLKLYVYGYLNSVRSSRRLEAECHRNIEVIWLLRTLKPDFKTIADFRADNRAAFKSVFRQFTLLCKRLDLFGRELLAVDGTRIKAVNNKDRNFTRNSPGDIHQGRRRTAGGLPQAARRGRRGGKGDGRRAGEKSRREDRGLEQEARPIRRHAEAVLERTGEDQISLTDPDSRAMAAHTRVAVGYNVQVAVDAKNKLIVEQEVTNQVVDMGLLRATAEPAREILEVRRIDVVADKGYFKTEDIAACEKAGLTPYVPSPQRGSSVSNGFFRKDEFLLRYGAGRIHMPGRSRTEAVPLWQVARDDEDRLRQQGRRAAIVRCAGAAPTPAIAPYRVWSTRTRWTAWRPA